MRTVNLGELRSPLKTFTVLIQTDWKVLAGFGAWCLSWAHLSHASTQVPYKCVLLPCWPDWPSPGPGYWCLPQHCPHLEKQTFNISTKIIQSTHSQKSPQWNKIGPSTYYQALHKKPTSLRNPKTKTETTSQFQWPPSFFLLIAVKHFTWDLLS